MSIQEYEDIWKETEMLKGTALRMELYGQLCNDITNHGVAYLWKIPRDAADPTEYIIELQRLDPKDVICNRGLQGNGIGVKQKDRPELSYALIPFDQVKVFRREQTLQYTPISVETNSDKVEVGDGQWQYNQIPPGSKDKVLKWIKGTIDQYTDAELASVKLFRGTSELLQNLLKDAASGASDEELASVGLMRTYPCCEAVRRIEAIPGDATTLLGGVCEVHGKCYHLTKTSAEMDKPPEKTNYVNRDGYESWSVKLNDTKAYCRHGVNVENCVECYAEINKDIKSHEVSAFTDGSRPTTKCPKCGIINEKPSEDTAYLCWRCGYDFMLYGDPSAPQPQGVIGWRSQGGLSTDDPNFKVIENPEPKPETWRDRPRML